MAHAGKPKFRDQPNVQFIYETEDAETRGDIC